MFGNLSFSIDSFKSKVADVKKKKVASRYQELIGEIVDPVNASRIQAGYKPLPYAMYIKRMKTAGIDPKDKWSLSIFLAKCKEANNHSAFFWWYVRDGYKAHE